MLRIAAIGAGRIGKIHAATVAAHPQARLVLVCDLFIEAAKTLAEFPGAHVSANAAEALSVNDASVIVIDSPTPLHAEYVLAVTRMGKTVLCEKPVASSAEAARALADELATFKYLPVMVGFQRRYDPSIVKAQRPAAEGRIGRIERLIIVSRDPALLPAEYLVQSGGVLGDMTIHGFDEAWFSLDEIIPVNAIGQKLDPALAGVDDFGGAITTLQAANNVVAIIENTCHRINGYDQKAEIFGLEGEVVAENPRATSVRVNDATGSVQQEVYLGFFLERCADVYRDELTAFTDAVNNGSSVISTVEDSVAALILAETVERSARSGQTVEVMR